MNGTNRPLVKPKKRLVSFAITLNVLMTMTIVEKWKWIKKAKTGRSHKNDTVYLFAKNQRSENAYMRKGLLN